MHSHDETKYIGLQLNKCRVTVKLNVMVYSL